MRTAWISYGDVGDGPCDRAIESVLTDEELEAWHEYAEVPEDVQVCVSFDWFRADRQGARE